MVWSKASASESPFRLTGGGTVIGRTGIRRVGLSAVERLLSLRRLESLYRTAQDGNASDRFIERAMDALHIEVVTDEARLATLPCTGPLIVVANHPFGGLDGLLLAGLIRRVRLDVKIMANYIGARVPELNHHCIWVDPFGGPGAAARNVAGMRQAVRWVRDTGGALIVFPAGEVAHLRLADRGVVESTWSPSIARLIRLTQSPVVPVHFPGRNSIAFQLAGLIHPRLRTVMLPREVVNKQGSCVHVEVGHVIPAVKLLHRSDEEMTDYLRARTELLSARVPVPPPAYPMTVTPPGEMEPIIDPVAAELIAAEIDALPAESMLVEASDLSTYIAPAHAIPRTLREIGRLRELAFRAVGEGTGNCIDLDRFDNHYLHLFVYRRTLKRIVGAYRLGVTDEILPKLGRAGMYCSTLFRISERVWRQVGPAIELGRSFVHPEHQREFSPLLMLWRGIATFVARHPHRHRLLGPVSVSREYQSLSQHILVEFLRHNRMAADLARFVRPRRRLKGRLTDALAGLLRSAAVADLDDVDELITEVESDGRSMPVLMRQYLKLNARVLGFNRDAAFSDVLDALMLVDLAEVQPMVLTRYMGRQTAAAFLAHHGVKI